MLLSVEDTRLGKSIKIDVKRSHYVESIIKLVVEHMGIIDSEQRSYALIHHGKELPNSITIGEAIQKYDLKEHDKLSLWARVIGGITNNKI
ncbi:MAG: hypothetical protein ACFE9X_07350 [Promethearchaeota archaeon]